MVGALWQIVVLRMLVNLVLLKFVVSVRQLLHQCCPLLGPWRGARDEFACSDSLEFSCSDSLAFQSSEFG